MIEIGLKYTSELTVTDAVTAITVGSGDYITNRSIWVLKRRKLLKCC